MSTFLAPWAAQQSVASEGAVAAHADPEPQPLVRSTIELNRYMDVVPGKPAALDVNGPPLIVYGVEALYGPVFGDRLATSAP